MKSHFSTPDSEYVRAYRRWFESPDYTPINRDTVLAAQRQHDRLPFDERPASDYEMRTFEDGSVFFRNTTNPSPVLRQIISLGEIQEASRHFWSRPKRPLWKHILHMWL